MDYIQRLLKDYMVQMGCQGILAPHPDGHVGIFASPSEKVGDLFEAFSQDHVHHPFRTHLATFVEKVSSSSLNSHAPRLVLDRLTFGTIPRF